MEQINSSINASLSKQITDNLADVRQKVTAIAEQNGVASEYVDAIMQDYEAVLMDKYTFLNMTPKMYADFITIGGTNTPDKWQPLMDENRALNIIFVEYKHICNAIYNLKRQYKDIENIPADELQKYVEMEITEDKTGWQVARSEILNYFGQCSIDIHDTAVIYKHIECLIALRRYFITTNEDLLPIKPINCAPLLSEELQKHNKAIIKQSDETMPKAAQRRKPKQTKDATIHPHYDMDALTAPKAERHRIYTDTSERQPKKDITLPLHQNVVDTISTEVQTALQDEAGEPTQWLPLRNALKESGATKTTLTYAMQSMKGFMALPVICSKVTEDETHVMYHTTLAQFTQFSSGMANYNSDILQNMYYALMWWSERWIKMTEWRSTYKVMKNGKIKFLDKYKPYEVQTQAITTTFSNQGKLFERDGKINGSTEIDVRIHKAIVYGRRERTEIMKKQNILIQQPCKYFLKLSQYQSFNTPEGINFQRIIMHCDRRTEFKTWNENKDNDILADIFGYKSRLQGLQDEELQKEKNNIRRNKPRDKRTLEDFFRMAKESGFIAEYEKKAAANGIDYVWTWKRTIPKEEIEETQPVLTLTAEA